MNIHLKPRILVPFLLVAGLVLGLIAFSSMGNLPQEGQQQAASLSAGAGKELLDQFSTAFEASAQKVNPSVVPIFSEQTRTIGSPWSEDQMRQFFGDDFFRRFFGGPGGDSRQTVRAMGSGVIVSSDGYILTNNHVVDGSEKLTVVLADKEKHPAHIVGRDPQTDVAVIKIDAKDLPVASLGNSDDIRVGQWVIAVGNPFQLYHTTTAGIVSATGRSSMNIADYEDFIQTDASINPGNSGGALADLDGNVIGINTAIFNPNGSGGNVGIGFAIPINLARSIMGKLIADGKVVRGYLGLVPQDINKDLADALTLKGTAGALVGDVSPDGPAEKAGVERGDVIMSFNGTKVDDSARLRNLVADGEPGTTVPMGILRNGHEKQLNVTLGERPDNLLAAEEERAEPETGSSETAGLSVQNLTPDVAHQLGYENEQGVLIAGVKAGSPAEESGLQRGDLIKEVNRKPVHRVKDFEEAVGKVGHDHGLAFLVRRNTTTFYVALSAAPAS